MAESPARFAKLQSTAQCELFVNVGWSLEHTLRRGPGLEPYEYILEWTRAGLALWPDGWAEHWSGIVRDQAQCEGLSAELQRELAPDHSLYARSLQPIARCRACDDVLFQDAADGSYALVHLTWGRRVETAPWPATRVLAAASELHEAMSDSEH